MCQNWEKKVVAHQANHIYRLYEYEDQLLIANIPLDKINTIDKMIIDDM
jgi:hypothetical protein